MDETLRERYARRGAAKNAALPVLSANYSQLSVDVESSRELTASERMIWAGQRLDPKSPLYNMSLAFHIEEALDPGALQRAYQSVVDDSDALRTVFLEGDRGPQRHVLPNVSVEVDVIDMPADQVSSDELDSFLLARARQVFRLDGTLTDLCLIRRGPRSGILFLNQHHLITDAWSGAVLLRRLSAAYETVMLTRESTGETYPQFAQFLEYERSRDGTEELDRARTHWTASRRSDPGGLTFYGHPKSTHGKAHRIRLALEPSQVEQLTARGAEPPFLGLTPEQSGFTVFATVLAAWLHRISGLEQIAIGMPWQNRSTPPFRDTLGLFVELYPLRIELDGSDSFRSLAKKVGRATLDMIRHIVPGASESVGANQFDVVLNYVSANMGDFAGHPVRTSWIHSGFVDPGHGLRIHVHDFDNEGRLNVDFDLDPSVFGAEEAAWALRHFGLLLDALVSDPGQSIGQVALTSAAEEAAIAPKGAEQPSSGTVLEMIWDQCARTPDAPALVEGEESIPYGAMASRIRGLAADLTARGIGPGSVVAICMERSADLVLGTLAILESGAAYLPLDAAAPRGRLSDVLSADGADLLLVAGRTSSLPETLGVPGVSMSALDSGLPPAEAHSVDRSDLAYVIYTSGSTGSPKGVEVLHGGLEDYLSWARRTYAPEGPVRLPLFTSPSFDFTITSMFLPLISGGSVVVYPDSDGPAALSVRAVFEDDAVDVVKLTPSHLALIRDMDLSQSTVRRLVLGGESLSTHAAMQAHRAFPEGVDIFNEYGPTEATVACMIHRFDPDGDRGPSVPIGVPSDNMRVHILDAAGHPTPRGVAGELCVAGPRVARGYRNRPDLTRASFVPEPGKADETMYRTGDRARWMPGGTAEFLGRLDSQVKVRGARVELGEIEAALGEHPDVQACAAYLSVGAPQMDGARCTVCGLEGAHPLAHLDDGGLCNVCRRFEGERDRVASYFGTMDQLTAILADAKDNARGEQDCVVLLSGGKDSTYALCRTVELGATPLVFMLDNGFISDQAKDNARRVVELLGLELVIQRPEGMNEILSDSLTRFSNVCEGCFKTVYTLAVNLARERGINTLVTGLSRGQIFETRLQDLYRRGIYEPDEVEETILTARKAYHRMDDAVSRLLDVTAFETDAVLEEVRFVDFYRYCDDTLDQVLRYIGERTPWIRPSDTGRSTNCLINEAGIFVHKSERGFHNYAMPYSWDVRLGHKERDAAIAELDDDLDPANVQNLLDQVSYSVKPTPPPETRLAVAYVAQSEIPTSALRDYLSKSLVAEAIPTAYVRLEELPIGPSGKVDREALPRPEVDRPLLESAYVAPRTPAESTLSGIWAEVLGLGSVGVNDNFFEIGGDSMHCIQIVSAALQNGIVFEPRDLFARPTIAELATLASTDTGPTRAPDAATVDAAELADLLDEYGEF